MFCVIKYEKTVKTGKREWQLRKKQAKQQKRHSQNAEKPKALETPYFKIDLTPMQANFAALDDRMSNRLRCDYVTLAIFFAYLFRPCSRSTARGFILTAMWFYYRKPRPPKNGAYFFCRQTKGPILSCFTEITNLAEDDTPEFKKVRYTLHVLGALYPNPEKSVKENTEQLVERLKAGHPIAIYPEAPV